jgi:hypothetical protein
MNCKIQRESQHSAVHCKKHKGFGIKIYKPCDRFGYTYDLRVYLGKARNMASTGVTHTDRTVLELVWKVEGVGHKIFMDNYFTSLKLSMMYTI